MITSITVLVILVPIYLLTNTPDEFQSRDPIAVALPAFRLAEEGSLDLSGFEEPWLTWRGPERTQTWYVRTEGPVVSVYPPGASLIGVPFYWILKTSGFSLGPAAVAASVIASLAMVLLHLAFRRIVSPVTAIGAALVAGLATSTWSVSADALWQHGPAQLWLALSLLGLASQAHYLSGFGFALTIITRPITSLIPLVTGVFLAFLERSIRPILIIGLVSSIGILALVAYNLILFDTALTTPHYAAGFADNLTNLTPLSYGRNVLGALVWPGRGLLIVSPFLLTLLPGIRNAWQHSPNWVRAAALSGVVYLLVHLALNRFSGGFEYFGYRYPLEALTMASPLLLLSYRHWIAGNSARQVAFGALVALSVGLQAYGSIIYAITPVV